MADNIDYDEIKHIIKENTTLGKAKALSIPGQGSDAERHFEHNLYQILLEEHDRIGLFVKSKSLEIHRRLGKLNYDFSDSPLVLLLTSSRTSGPKAPTDRAAQQVYCRR